MKVIPHVDFYWLPLSHLQLSVANEMHQTSKLHMVTHEFRKGMVFRPKSDKYLHRIESRVLRYIDKVGRFLFCHFFSNE